MNPLAALAPLFAVILVLWIASRLAVSDADHGRAANEIPGGKIVFLPNRRSYWGIFIIIALLIYPILVELIRGIKGAADISLIFLCLGFVVFLLTTYPGSIVATNDGLEQIYWFGGKKRIAWSDVSGFEIDKKKKRVIVKARNGAKIVHTRQLPDKNRIIGEIELHCPGRLPADAAEQLAS